MATISIDGSNLNIDVEGMDRLWAMKSRLTIPLAHVRGAGTDPEITRRPKGWRGPGAYVPGVIAAGTFHKGGDKVFWDVHDNDRAVVIELADETYQRLVIEVDDPSATVELIERAIAQR
jgi:hypothetical protein